MANVKKVKQNAGPVTVELGDKVRVLQFDLNAFAELELKYGSVQAAMDELTKGKISDVRHILWAGLIHEEVVLDEITGEPLKYNITPYQVGNWVKNLEMIGMVSAKLSEALSSSMPDPDTIPGAKEALKKAGLTVVDGEIAQIVQTEAEKAEEAKND